MSAYDLKRLIKMWWREELTIEQAIGQILLHLQKLARRLAALERQLGVEPPPDSAGKGEET